MKFFALLALLALCTTSLHVVDAQTTGPRRGVYISPYADNIGSFVINDPINFPERLQFYRILGDLVKEDAVLAWLKRYHINAISVYDLYKILPFAGLTASLRSFIVRARAAGVEKVEAVGGTNVPQDYDRINTYQLGCATDSEKFDGLVTEIEFWHAHEVHLATDAVSYARGLSIPAQGATPFYYAVYCGWVNTTEVQLLAPLSDYLWFHTPTTNHALTYAFSDVRIGELFAASGTTNVVALLYAEGTAANAGGAAFLGDYLASGGTMRSAQDQYKADYDAARPGDAARLSGYQWYEYVFCKTYQDLSLTPSVTVTPDLPTPAPPTPSPPTPVPPSPPSPAPPTPVGMTTTTTAAPTTTAMATTTTANPVTTTTTASPATTTGPVVTTTAAPVAPTTTATAAPTNTSTTAGPASPPANLALTATNAEPAVGGGTSVIIVLVVVGVLLHVGLLVVYCVYKKPSKPVEVEP